MISVYKVKLHQLISQISCQICIKIVLAIDFNELVWYMYMYFDKENEVRVPQKQTDFERRERGGGGSSKKKYNKPTCIMVIKV